jgi:hypothetical protein
LALKDKPARGYKGWHAEIIPYEHAHNRWYLYFFDPEGKKYSYNRGLNAKNERDVKRQARKALKKWVDALLEDERQKARTKIVI